MGLDQDSKMNCKWIANKYKWITNELQANYKWIASELQMNCKVNSLSRKSEKQTSEKEVANSIWTIHRNE